MSSRHNKINRSKACSICQKITSILVTHDACSLQLMCLLCLKNHREKLKKQIEKLPEVTPALPPLGHHFVQNRYFTLDSAGRFFMNEIWAKFIGFIS